MQPAGSIYIYIYYCWKSPNQVICMTMVSWMQYQSSGSQKLTLSTNKWYVPYFMEAAILFKILTKWLPPWNKGRITCLWIKSIFDCLTIGITSMKPWSYKWLDLDFFNNNSNYPRTCVLSTLCGNIDKHIYVYIYINMIHFEQTHMDTCPCGLDPILQKDYELNLIKNVCCPTIWYMIQSDRNFIHVLGGISKTLMSS